MFRPLLVESGTDDRFLLELRDGSCLLLEDSSGPDPGQGFRELRVLNSQYAERRSSRNRRHAIGHAMQRRKEGGE